MKVSLHNGPESIGPLLKVMFYLVFASVVFVLTEPVTLYILGFTSLLIFLAYPGGKMLRGIVPLSIFLAVTFFSNLAFSEGRVVLSFRGFSITEESLIIASVRTIRVFLLVAGVKILTLSTGMDGLVGALGKLLAPLKLMKLPVDDFLEIFVMSLSVFPFVKEELKSSYEGHITGKIPVGALGKAKAFSSVLIPSLVEIIAHPEKFYRKYGVDSLRPEEPGS